MIQGLHVYLHWFSSLTQNLAWRYDSTASSGLVLGVANTKAATRVLVTAMANFGAICQRLLDESENDQSSRHEASSSRNRGSWPSHDMVLHPKTIGRRWS
ncbi:hypothetical protein CH063_02906 [Colletotrichum higginsianum]|uniref:Uncharacterized protein n=1 Tax=Colletotrichum higginsianum (strain IMI 349063) TaxID=759273 RepID=H1VR70_COLHI|nr:hypothetical protein CH063_02906 [Colletotrichum higginsianum]